MHAVILAGKKGTRLASYSVAIPKPLLPVGDQPLLEVVVRQLKHHGCTRITIAVGYLADVIQAYFGDGSRLGVDIDYSQEDHPLGTAGPVRLIPDLPDNFLVVNGDLLSDLDYGKLFRRHVHQGNVLTIGVYKRHLDLDIGVLERDPEGLIVDYREKPTIDYEVSMGVYAYSKEALQYIPEGPFEASELVQELLRRGEQIRGFNFKGTWLDIGRYEEYGRAIEIFEKERHRFLPGE
jgi:NDP-sugar pyrophosphorylase family protein